MKAIATLLFLASTAAAEPAFDSLSMGRHTPVSTFSFEFGYEVWDEPAATDIDIYTLNFAGHFVGRKGVGGYFVLPITYLDIRSGLFDDSDLAIGNVELGALYTKWFGRHTAIAFHGGLALPTAQDDGVAAAQFLGSFTRLSDAALHVTNSTWLRLGLSPLGFSGRFMYRADIGVDLAVDEDNAVEISPIFYLNLGAGFDLGGAQLLAELVNVVSDPEDNSDDSASTLTLGARFVSGNLRPGVGLLLPIDFDNVDFEFAILASIAVRVPGL